jgi:hypothetical protein
MSGSILDFGAAKRRKEVDAGTRGSATTLHDWNDEDVERLSGVIQMSDSGVTYVFLRDAPYVGPDDGGLALTPTQARKLAIDLIEGAAEADRKNRKHD